MQHYPGWPPWIRFTGVENRSNHQAIVLKQVAKTLRISQNAGHFEPQAPVAIVSSGFEALAGMPCRQDTECSGWTMVDQAEISNISAPKA